MPCCGDARARYREETVSVTGGGAVPWSSRALQFEYTGQGQMTVTGPFTGMVYRFPRSGSRVQVHASDVPSLAAVPGLQPVR